MTPTEQTPIAYFLVTQFQFVCADCLPSDAKGILTFYEEEEIVGYYNDLHIGFESEEHKAATEGKGLTISCVHCKKNLAQGQVTHELSDIFAE
jgi:hypothetical protein